MDLEDKVHALERDMKGLTHDWDDYADRFRRLLAKIAKRSKVDEAPESSQTGERPTGKAGPLPESMNPLAARLLSRGKGNGVLPG
jgi:hypothetical protein